VSATAESAIPTSSVIRRQGRHDLLRPLQLAFGLLIAVAQLYADNGVLRSVLALSPVLLIVTSRRRIGSADVIAGGASLLIAFLDQLRPLDSARSFVVFGFEPNQVIPLVVIGWVLLRLRSAQKDLADLSRLDSLTGLLNRRGFESLAEKELGRAARYQRPIAFALIDLDHFKEINDRFGHAHGDEVLRAVASELANLRSFDLPVRLGGDEFGLLMPETDEAAAQRVVSRLAQRLRERLGNESPQISMSVGIATSSAPPRPLADLMVEADRRMYSHKQEEHAAHAAPRGAALQVE
jgi:diguanylate cyclase (GGDEF)-like protein